MFLCHGCELVYVTIPIAHVPSFKVTHVTHLRLQKWSKGKVKEKLANLVLFDKATYDKMLADVPKQKLITPSIISEKLKVNGSLARKAVKELLSKNLIRASLHCPSNTPLTFQHEAVIYSC